RGRGRIVVQEPLAQSRGAQLDTSHPKRLRVFDQYQLHAAAADVEQQVRSAFKPERVPRGLVDKLGLFGSRDDLDRDAAFLAHAADEIGAIAGFADSAGGDRTHAIDTA